MPPTERLEGIDLRHYQFRAGHVYSVGPRMAQLLIASGYAERERRQPDTDRRRRD